MRLRLEVQDPAELEAKSEQLVKSLAREVRPHAPLLADRLEKAVEDDRGARPLRARALQESVEDTRRLYTRMLDDMLLEVGREVERALREAAPKED